MIVSQFITLYVTPVIYLYLEDFQEKVLDRTRFFRSSRAHMHEDGGSRPQREILAPLVTVGPRNGNGHD